MHQMHPYYRCFLSFMSLALMTQCHLFDSEGKQDAITNKSSVQAVFGKDTRIKLYNDQRQPYSVVGRVEYDKDATHIGYCTGALVGNDLIVTSAHCIVDWKTGKYYKNLRFYPAYTKGKSRYGSRILHARVGDDYVGVKNKLIRWRNDWAVARLSTPLGKKLGHLGVKRLDVTNKAIFGGPGYILVGYSSDIDGGEFATVDFRCTIKELLDSDNYGHDCDAMTGASGGPILEVNDKTGKFTNIVAIHGYGSPDHPKHYTRGSANEAILSQKFIQAVIDGQKNDVGKDFYTSVQVCNDSSEDKLQFSYVFKSRSEDRWTSRHWIGVEKGKCTEVLLEARYVGSVYFYGIADGGSVIWSGNGAHYFCHHSEFAKTITHAKKGRCVTPYAMKSYSGPLHASYRRFNEFRFGD